MSIKKSRKPAKTSVCALFQQSLAVQAKLFFEHSTLHGVRYIAEHGRPLVEKLMWFVCVAVGAITSIVIIFSLWEKFQTNPTITGLDTDFHTWDVPFPAITICQNEPSNESVINDYIDSKYPDSKRKDDLYKLLYKLTKLNYKNLKDIEDLLAENLLGDDVDIKRTAFELMNPCETIFSTCIFKGEAYNCCESFFPVFTESGFCYSFNGRYYEKSIPWLDVKFPDFKMAYIKETDAKWALKMRLSIDQNNNNLAIFIHNSDEIPGIESKPQHVWDFKVERILFSVKQTYTTDDTRQLSVKQRHCLFEWEKKLKMFEVYTYISCTQQCRMDNALSLCNCVPHFYPESDKSAYKHCNLKQLKCIINNYNAIMAVEKCKCHLGCSNTVYEAEKLIENPMETNTETLQAEFVSWPMVRYKREVLFGWVDLLVSFGGIAGLFLGFSLLSGVEVIYYFTMRACCMVYKQPDELLRSKQDVSTKKEKFDLSLWPNEKAKEAEAEVLAHNRQWINFPNKKRRNSVKARKHKAIISPYGIDYNN